MATVALKAKLTLNKSAFSSGMKAAKGEALAFGNSIGNALKSAVTSPLAAIGGLLAGAFSVGKFVEGVKGALDMGEAMENLKARTGESVDNLLIFRQVLKANNVDAEEAGPILNKMQKSIEGAAESGALAYENFGRIGLGIKDIIRLSPVAQFQAIEDALAKIKNPAERAQDAMKIFGKSGGQLLGAHFDAKGFEDAAKSIGKQAAILKENSVNFDIIAERLGRASLKFQGFFVGFTSAVVPDLLAFTDALEKSDFADAGQKFGAGIKDGVDAFVGTFSHPEIFTDLLSNSLQAAALDFGNSIAAVFRSIPASVSGELEEMGTEINAMFQSVRDVMGGMSPKNAATKKQLDSEEAQAKFAKIQKDLAKGMENPEDLFGAQAYHDKVKAGFEALREAGAKAIDEVLHKSTGVAEKKVFTSNSSLTKQYSSIIGASMALGTNAFASFFSAGNQGITGFGDSSLNKGAYNQSQLLNARERRGFEDSAVARGERPRTATANAFGAIRSGDTKRRKDFEKSEARKAAGVDRTNQLLEGITGDVSGINKAFVGP